MGILLRFGGWLLGGLVTILPSIVGQVLVSLGLGVVTYTGMSATLGWLKSSVVSSFAGLPVEVLNMLSLMQVGSCISMVFSAMVIRLAIQGMSGASFKRWVKT